MGPAVCSQKGVNRIANRQDKSKTVICPASAVCCIGEGPLGGGVVVAAAYEEGDCSGGQRAAREDNYSNIVSFNTMNIIYARTYS